jgi:hypothetical protein
MRVKLAKESPNLDHALFCIPGRTEWATAKQITQWMSVDADNANRIGARLGRAEYRCIDISYQGTKTRAWYFGDSPIEDWDLHRVRAELERNDATMPQVLQERAARRQHALTLSQ